MKTGRVVVGLFVLLVTLVGPWMVAPATPQEPIRVRAWVLINFSRAATDAEIDAVAGALWREGGVSTPADRRWGMEAREEERPQGAAIARISRIRAFLKGGSWEAVILIVAPSEKELLAVVRYIERYYSHVEIYSVRGADFQ